MMSCSGFGSYIWICIRHLIFFLFFFGLCDSFETRLWVYYFLEPHLNCHSTYGIFEDWCQNGCFYLIHLHVFAIYYSNITKANLETVKFKISPDLLPRFLLNCFLFFKLVWVLIVKNSHVLSSSWFNIHIRNEHVSVIWMICTTWFVMRPGIRIVKKQIKLVVFFCGFFPSIFSKAISLYCFQSLHNIFYVKV